MSLGKRVADWDSDVAVVREAIDAGLWLHTSQEYAGGGTFMVLRRAFDELRQSHSGAKLPGVIFKIRCDSAATIRFDVEDACRRLGLERVDVAQLCRDTHDHRRIVDDFLNAGPMHDECRRLVERGLVGHYVFEVFPGFADDAYRAVEHDLFPGCILYLNPTQRNAPRSLWDLMQKKGTPVLALRTLGAVRPTPRQTAEAFAAKGQHDRAVFFKELQQVVDDAGCTWPRFCVRYALSLPNVVTTIGGTSSRQHLRELIEAAEAFRPLDRELIERVERLLTA